MSCDRFEERIITRDANEPPDSTLAGHLESCASCADFAAVSQANLDALRDLAPSDPGEAFFAVKRNEIWSAHNAVREQAASRGLWARWFADVRSFFDTRGRRTAALAMGMAGAVAVIAAVLWSGSTPKPIVGPPEVAMAIPAEDLSETDVVNEVNELADDERDALASQLVIEAPALAVPELEEDPSTLESEIETLSPEERKDFSTQLAQALRVAQGA